jgi:hypothetical protein
MDLEKLLSNHPDLREHADLIVIPPSWEEVCEEFKDAAPDAELQLKGNYYCRCVYDGMMTILASYVILRRGGSKHNFAAQIALQKAPKCETNDTFWSGRKPFHEVFGHRYADGIREKLAKQGVPLGSNSEYMPELARYPGDPEAVVPSHDVRGHIRKVVESRGMIYKSPTDIECREPESDPHAPENCVAMAPDLIRKNAVSAIKADPTLANKSNMEIREAVLDKYGPTK